MTKPSAITLPPVVLGALQEAVRIAARTDGAPHRCDRRACRNSGRCHAELDHAGDPDCGGVLSARAEESAVDMLVFLYKLRREAENAAA